MLFDPRIRNWLAALLQAAYVHLARVNVYAIRSNKELSSSRTDGETRTLGFSLDFSNAVY